MEALTISESQSGQCANPVCGAWLPESSRKPRQFCNDKCRMDAWVLKRAVSILSPLGQERALSILRDISDGRI